MTTKQPKIAVVGSGYWGKNLVRNYHQLDALAGICDKNVDLLKNFKTTYPEVHTCIALQDILNDATIDGVAIATPAETHYTLAREALLAGKHVYVEKPLVLDNAEGRDLISLADEQQLTLMVGHLLQYHPAFIHLKKLVRSGELGRVNYIYSNRLNLGKIRREENILWSFAPHDISMILSIAGEMPEKVYATGGNYLHQKIADVTTTHLEFPSGLRSHIFVSWLHPFKEQKLVIVGEKKMAVFNDTLPWDEKLVLYDHTIEWEENLPVPTAASPKKIAIPESEPLKLECQQFLNCITNGEKPVTDGREGLRVLKVLNAAQVSLDKNRAVAIDIIDKASPEESGVDYFCHDSALIDEGCAIGADTKIWHFSHILSGSVIGEGCNIGQNVMIGPDVQIGNGCKVQNNVSVYKGVILEDDVFCGPSMVFTNVHNPRAFLKRMDEARTTRVKKGATLGANCTIVCGNTIGAYALVGAGSVVVKDVPDYAVVAGNPAAPIGWVCKCGSRLDDQHQCPECGLAYRLVSGQLSPHN